MNLPLITIGMPLFNTEKTLGLTIRSIVNQSYSNWRLIMIDDGSTDGTVAVARSFADERITVIEGGVNKGLPTRLNETLDIASGAYFARMDSDDIAYPERLETQVRFLMDHPEIDLLGCGMITFRGDGVALGKRATSGTTHEELCRHPQRGIHLGHPTFMGKLDWFRKHGYRPASRLVEDQDLMLRSYKTSRFACVPQVLLAYREDTLSLRKLLRHRRRFLRVVLWNARRSGQSIPFVEIGRQLLKAGVDIAAVGSGFGYRLLPQRAATMDASEIEKWHEVWELTTSS